MATLRLTSGGLVDVDFTGLRLTSGGLIEGSAIEDGAIISALPDSLVLSESVAAIIVSKTISAAAQGLILSESASEVIISKNIDGLFQSITLTESTANIFIGSNITINGLPQSLSLVESLSLPNIAKNINSLPKNLSLNESVAGIRTDKNIYSLPQSISVLESTAFIKLDAKIIVIPQFLNLNENTANIFIGSDTAINGLPHLLSLSENESNVKTDINVNGLPQQIILNESIGKIRLDINTNTIPQYLNFVESVANIFIGSDLTVNVLPQSLAFTESNGAIELPVTIAILPQALNIVESSAVINTSGLRSLKMVLEEITDRLRLLENITTQDKDDIITGVLETDTSANEDFNTLGGAISHLKHLEYQIFINTELVNPAIEDGSQHYPYSLETPAIDYAESHGILNLHLLADITLARQVKNFHITSTKIANLDFDDQDVGGSRFSYLSLNGNYIGSITAQHCQLSGTSTLNGYFDNCALGSTFTIPDLGSALVKNCSEFTEGFIVPPSFDIGGIDGTAKLHLKDFIGGAKIINCTKDTDEVKIVATGQIEIDSSCIKGNIIVFGIVKPVDNSGVNCNVVWSSINPVEIKDIHAAEWHRRRSVGNVDTIYENDGITERLVADITTDEQGVVIEINPR